MQYRRMGTSGLPLSVLSFGAWVTFGSRIGRGEARELIAQAYDAGVNFFDNAETYAHGEAERIMGDALADMRLPRDAWCVSSKVYFGASEAPRPTQRGLSRKHVIEACHQALQRLRVEYLDLYFCHRPDPETPVEETVAAMDFLVRQGKVLYWGTSEWPAALIRDAARFAHANGLQGPSVEQPQYNLLHRERVEFEYAPLYAELGLGTTTWSPLASGLLSGKYRDGIPPGSRLQTPGYSWLQRQVLGDARDVRQARVQRYLEVARDLGMPPAPLAIAWCLKNPRVSSVIVGASSAAQLAENLTAIELLPRLDDAALDRIEAAFAT